MPVRNSAISHEVSFVPSGNVQINKLSEDKYSYLLLNKATRHFSFQVHEYFDVQDLVSLSCA
jgi:hypothetical protein